MKDETKETIKNIELILKINTSGMVLLERKNIKDLLDYITNLQEELKSVNESITWWTDRFKAVEEENKRLKELDENYPIEEQLEEALKREVELQDRLDTLKIEISSLMSRYFYEKDFCIEDTHLDKLLRIIDGDDKDEK